LFSCASLACSKLKKKKGRVGSSYDGDLELVDA
jgi:hypothetical protein